MKSITDNATQFPIINSDVSHPSCSSDEMDSFKKDRYKIQLNKVATYTNLKIKCMHRC